MPTGHKHAVSDNEFQDKRLLERRNIIVKTLEKNPHKSIPQAFETPAAMEGMYRFLESDRVHEGAIDTETYKATLERAKGVSMILVAQDTMALNYSSLHHTKGLGPIDQYETQGMLVHTGLAMTTTGIPLGVLDRRTIIRDAKEFGKKKQRHKKPTAEKESQRWLDCESAIASRIPSDMRVCTISDREGDFYDHLAEDRRPGMDLLVRAAHNRPAEDSEVDTLFSLLEASKPQGHYKVKTIDTKTKKQRTATMTYRYMQVVLRAPQGGCHTHTHPITLWAIMAREEHPPAGVESLEWKLLTTMEILNKKDAKQCILWYSYRWRIERFHYIMKSGCQIEELQLKKAESLKKAVALYAAVAARILYMTYLSRIKPNASADTILTRQEWEALCCIMNDTRTPPSKPPTLKMAILMIAKLGGFKARKGDGDPGVKVLWRGLQRLADITKSYILFTSK